LISSGSGIHHSAGNSSKTNFSRNLQIWIQPRELNILPSTQIKTALKPQIRNYWILQFSPNGAGESINLLQDAWLSKERFDANSSCEYVLYAPNNSVMVCLIDGKIELNGQVLEAHDTLFLYEAEALSINIIK
jgi:redox-sensitive bicupin YhaK (pirin superfamily)